MKLLRDLILIKVDKTEDESKGGVLLVEEWKSCPPRGEVLEVGPDVKTVKVGDRVQFERYSSIILDDERRISKEDDIFAIL